MSQEKNKTGSGLTDRSVLYIVIGVVAVALIVGAVFCIKYGLDKKYGSTGKQDETTGVSGETIPGDVSSIQILDLSTINPFWKFTYNGETFEMPFAFNKLVSLGLLTEDDDPSAYLIDAGLGHQTYLYNKDDADREDYCCQLEIFNASDDSAAATSCPVVSFLIDKCIENAETFTLNGGITFASSVEDLKKVFGNPSYEDIDDSGSGDISWVCDDSYYNVFNVSFIDGEINSFSIDYAAPIENYEYNLDNGGMQDIVIEE